jgi:L-fuculose-phosphate aldolase
MPNPWKLKQEMCEIGRRMYERGLVSAFEGNISARLGPDRLLCTPSLLCKGFLKPEDLCVVDMTGKQVSGDRKRSSEIFLHLGTYRERPEAEAVVHTHAPHATAFAITHTPVPNCITGEVEVFLGEVPLVPYATPGSEQMGEVVAQVLREHRLAGAESAKPQTQRLADPMPTSPPFAMLLANHGTVSWGKSLEQALHRTEILEAYCRVLILARQLGPVQRLSDQNMHDLLALKQKLGLPDRRIGQGSFEDCDLCGNNVFGRGFCEASKEPQSDTRDAARDTVGQTQALEFEAIVREIADRVMNTL